MALKALKYLYRGPLQNRQYIDDELSLIKYPHKNIKNSVLVFVNKRTAFVIKWYLGKINNVCNSCLFVLQFSFSVLFNLNVCVYMDFIHQLITNEVADDRVSSMYVYIHCFTLQSFTGKQFSLIIDQPRLLG